MPSDVFVGRAREVAALDMLISRHRVVTVVGVAGIGKTRLAAEYIKSFRGRYEAVHRVDVESLDGGLRDEGRDLVEALASRSRSRDSAEAARPGHPSVAGRVLVWLDGCERSLGGCRRMVAHLLSLSSGITVLLSSREPAAVPDEALLRLGALSIPHRRPEKAASALVQSDAVLLFVERARMVDRAFRLNPGNLNEVVGICERVEGNPLAIELAAQWVRLLSVGDILDGLEDPATFLLAMPGSGGSRGFAEAIAHSRGLPGTVESRLSRRLSVFPGDFSVDGATALCCDSGADYQAVVDALRELEARALLVRVDGTDRVRFRQPGPVRKSEFQSLEEAGEVGLAYDRLIGWAMRLAEPFFGPGIPVAVDVTELVRESMALRRALEWTLQQVDPRAQALAPAVARSLLEEGKGGEACALLHRALAVSGPDGPFRASCVWAVAWHAFIQCDYVTSLGRSLDANAIERSLNRPVRLLLAIGLAAASHVELGDTVAAVELVEEGYSALAKVDHDFEAWAPAALALAEVLIYADDVGAAETILREYRTRAHAMSIEQPVYNREREDMLAAQIALARDEVLQAQDILLAALQRNSGHLRRVWLGYGLMIVSSKRGFHSQALLLAGLVKRWSARTQVRPSRWWRQRFESAYDESTAVCGVGESFIVAEFSDETTPEALSVWLAEYLSGGVPAPEGKRLLLTARETEVAGMLFTGMTNYQIAQRMGISRRTVETHLDNIRKKTGMRTRAQLSVWAFVWLKGGWGGEAS